MHDSKIKQVHLHQQGMCKETKEGGGGGSCTVPMCNIAAIEVERTLLRAGQEAYMHGMGQSGMPHPAHMEMQGYDSDWSEARCKVFHYRPRPRGIAPFNHQGI